MPTVPFGTITEPDADIEKLLRANGQIVKRKNAEIIRYEIDDNHYYYISGIGYVPGVTTILDEAAPVGFGLREFWKNNSKDESELILHTAGDFGSKMHHAFEDLLGGIELNLLEDYPITREKEAVMRFADWFNTMQPREFVSEQVVASSKYMFAGTLDFLGYIKRSNAAKCMYFKTKIAKDTFLGDDPDKEELWLIDFKTSKGLHFSHELQGAAYKQAVIEGLGVTPDRIGLMRVPTTHKAGYEFKEVNYTIDDFLNVYRTYLNLHGGKVPQPQEIKVYPPKFRLLDPVKNNDAKEA